MKVVSFGYHLNFFTQKIHDFETGVYFYIFFKNVLSHGIQECFCKCVLYINIHKICSVGLFFFAIICTLTLSENADHIFSQ